MLPPLYTLGYEKRSIGEFLDLLLEAGVGVLVDVRETAWSHKRGFSKTAFAGALAEVGVAYLHAPYAGNPKALRAAAPTHAACLDAYRQLLERETAITERFDALVLPYLEAGTAVCITCFERHPEDCHRSILAAAWKRRAPRRRRVEHLATTGCARLVGA